MKSNEEWEGQGSCGAKSAWFGIATRDFQLSRSGDLWGRVGEFDIEQFD